MIDEHPDPSVVKQLTPHSCVAAVGEMLLQSRGISVSQLNRIDKPVDEYEWFGGIVDVDGPEVLIDLFGKFAAVLREGDPVGHLVLVDSVAGGQVEIRDPWDGTAYRMTRRDFLSVWDGGIVQRWNL